MQLMFGQIFIEDLKISLNDNFQQSHVVFFGEAIENSLITVSLLEINENTIIGRRRLISVYTMLYFSGKNNTVIVEKLKTGPIKGFEFGLAIAAINIIRSISVSKLNLKNFTINFKNAVLLIEMLDESRKVFVEFFGNKIAINQKNFYFGYIVVNSFAALSIANTTFYINSNYNSPLILFNPTSSNLYMDLNKSSSLITLFLVSILSLKPAS